MNDPPTNLWFDPSAEPPDIDNHLATASYTVRSSDLRHVAQRLETLESTMLSDSVDYSVTTTASPLCSNAVHYNPSDLSGWVDSMLSQISPGPPPNSHRPSLLPPLPVRQQVPAHMDDQDSGIRLVHVLMSCAERVQRGDTAIAMALIDEMRSILSNISTAFGIGKVAGYFVEALVRRLHRNAHLLLSPTWDWENEVLYHNFYEAGPYFKFAHFTANQAILEAFDGHDKVHVVDIGPMHGLQWPALIQALALRPGGPPFLRITVVAPPSSIDGRCDSLHDIGLRLADLSRSVGVGFAFHGVATNWLDDVKPWTSKDEKSPAEEEAVAVNSVLQLHRLLGDGDDSRRVDCVLAWIHRMKPKIVTVVEQEANHNKADFLDRFTEALFYYSTMFDSLDAGCGEQINALAEVYLQREICNVLCCEGDARTERHEPLAKWRARMGRAGFSSSRLGTNAYKQASMLLTLFSGDGYCVEEVDGCLTLGWHGFPLISTSAWSAAEDGNHNDGQIEIGHDNSSRNCGNSNNVTDGSEDGVGSSSSSGSNTSNNGAKQVDDHVGLVIN